MARKQDTKEAHASPHHPWIAEQIRVREQVLAMTPLKRFQALQAERAHKALSGEYLHEWSYVRALAAALTSDPAEQNELMGLPRTFGLLRSRDEVR